MLIYIYSITIFSALVLIWDARKRGWSLVKSLAGAAVVFAPLMIFPYRGFLWAYFLLPIYIAIRPPKANEVKIGGWQWHYSKNLALSIGILYLVMLGVFFALRTKVIESPFLLDGYDPSILELPGFLRITVLPVTAIVVAYLTGRFLRNDSIVAYGPQIGRLVELMRVPPAKPDEPVVYRDGKYWIAGHNIGLSSILDAWSEGEITPENIAETHFSTLTAREIKAALDYYLKNKDEINRVLNEERLIAESAAAISRKNPSPVRTRINQLLKEKTSVL